MQASKGCKGAAIGGVLRDWNGNQMWGFAAGIGYATVDEAELKAVKFGLENAWYQRIEKIVVEMDSPNIINLLSEELEENHLLGIRTSGE